MTKRAGKEGGRKSPARLSKGTGHHRVGNLEAGSESGYGEGGWAGPGLEAKTRSELHVFLKFGEERLSYPLPRTSLRICEFALPASI